MSSPRHCRANRPGMWHGGFASSTVSARGLGRRQLMRISSCPAVTHQKVIVVIKPHMKSNPHYISRRTIGSCVFLFMIYHKCSVCGKPAFAYLKGGDGSKTYVCDKHIPDYDHPEDEGHLQKPAHPPMEIKPK